jgi:hypothetical protein
MSAMLRTSGRTGAPAVKMAPRYSYTVSPVELIW